MSGIERIYVWEEPLPFADYPVICAVDDNPIICKRVEEIKKRALSSVHGEVTLLGWDIVITTPTPSTLGTLSVRLNLLAPEEWFSRLNVKGM